MRMFDRLDNFAQPRDLKCNFVGTALAIGMGVASAVGGVAKGIGASKAANAQSRAADAAVAEQQRQYDLTRADQKPWMDAGGKAITTLGQMVQPGGELYRNFEASDFKVDPGYNFILQQGQQALDRRRAAGGSFQSGSAIKEAVDYNQGMADQQYGKAYDRFNNNRAIRYNQLAGVSGAGQIATNNLAAVGANKSNNVSDALIYQGNARASGYMGIANAFNGGLQGIMASQNPANYPRN
jgi:hypothetical protein